ncbi:MAG TPA: hypothetical protein VEH49_04975, partial [Methylomirabilota bacterium]|nr:hypothetical protein [Methylomirabilota bacterium]
LGNKALEETSSAQNPGRAKLPREPGHGLELIRDHDNLHLMEIYGPLAIIEDAAKLFLDAVFDPPYSQRVANTRVKETDVGTRINPTLD